eukprot:13821522-Alexandrium_andersonii.AAC.1
MPAGLGRDGQRRGVPERLRARPLVRDGWRRDREVLPPRRLWKALSSVSKSDGMGVAFGSARGSPARAPARSGREAVKASRMRNASHSEVTSPFSRLILSLIHI